MVKITDMDLEICQEGCAGHMWHLSDAEEGNVFTSMLNYLNEDFAEDSAENFEDAVLRRSWIMREHPHSIGYDRYGIYLYHDSEWGYYALLSLRGPVGIEVCTKYFETRDALMKMLYDTFIIDEYIENNDEDENER